MMPVLASNTYLVVQSHVSFSLSLVSSTFDNLVIIKLYVDNPIGLDRLHYHALEVDW